MLDLDPRDYDSRDEERHTNTPSRDGRGSSGDHERDHDWRQPDARTRDRDDGDERSLGRGPGDERQGLDAEGRERDHKPRWTDRDRHVHLPRARDCELVHDRDREYTLRGSESRTLATVGAFRVVSSRDLRDHDGSPADPRSGDLRHLREQGLIETTRVAGYRDHAVSLTKDGRSLLESHRDPDHEHSQTFYAGLGRERELEHDLQVYRAYEQAEDRLLDRGAHIERVVLDHEPKSEYQRWLHKRDKDHDDDDGHPDRTPDEIREWAYEHNLPYFDDEVHFPDVRLEYQEPDGRWEREDIEVVTPHYRGAHGASVARGLLLLSRIEPAPLDQRRRATRRAQRRPGRGALAMTHEERIRAVVDCGFTERQARFLVLVMRHGGICIPRQYAGFAGIANGGRRCNAFFDTLVKRRYSHEIRCVHNRARVYHVHHKPLYFSSGKRRAATAGRCRRGSQSSA